MRHGLPIEYLVLFQERLILTADHFLVRRIKPGIGMCHRPLDPRPFIPAIRPVPGPLELVLSGQAIKRPDQTPQIRDSSNPYIRLMY